MKRIQGLKIGWTLFRVEELTARESANMVDAYNHLYKYADLYDAYKKPSEAKVSVWNAWISWAEDVNTFFAGPYEVQNLSICATNCQMVTVCAIIREYDEDEIVATYIMVATKNHNYLYKLASVEDGEDLDLCW